jgi:salicylate hydroxylase
MRIAIVGAGMGGLTLALALQRAGLRPTVYEQAPALAEIGAGLTLSPNASRVIEHLGLAEGLAAISVTPHKQWTQALESGAVIIESARGPGMRERHGAPYVHVHRADLHALLAEAVRANEPRALQLGHALVGITSDANGARLQFANGITVDADVAVGADGVKSVVRDALFPTQPPHFTGQVAWRGLVPLSALPPEVQALPPGIHIGPRRLFLRYPLRGGSLINYAAFVETSSWQGEGWSIRSSIDELLHHFIDAEPAVQAWIKATPPDQLFKWALHAREPLATWRAGRTTLLGDAAHAMLPFMGQGAATSLEDAMVLARCLAAFSVDDALRRYEAVRRERTTLIQTQSRLLGLKFQGKDPESLGRGPIQNEETLGLFDYDATTVAI